VRNNIFHGARLWAKLATQTTQSELRSTCYSCSACLDLLCPVEADALPTLSRHKGQEHFDRAKRTGARRQPQNVAKFGERKGHA